MSQEMQQKVVSLAARARRVARKAQRAALRKTVEMALPAGQDVSIAPSDEMSVAKRTLSPAARVMREDAIERQIPPLPQRAKSRSAGTAISFLVCVILPILAAAAYYTGFAADRYIVEFRFAVRETAGQGSSAAVNTDLSSLINGSPVASNASENYMVTEYLASRQVIDAMQDRIDLKSMYTRSDIDWWSRFDSTQPIERFYKYWQAMVRTYYDQATGIAGVQVTAFKPDEAHLIASTMMALAEELINDVAMRPRKDTLRFAEQEVERATARLKQIRMELHDYRAREAVIDPTSSIVTGNAQLAQMLRKELSQFQVELATLTSQKIRNDSPQILVLQSRIQSVKQQLVEIEKEVGTPGDQRSLSNVVARYEELEFDRQIAQTILTSTIQSLEKARVGTMLQHLYVTPFVLPHHPQSSVAPNRPLAILTIGLAFFFLWTIGLLTFRSIREHVV